MSRALSPVVGVVLLAFVTVLGAAAVGAMVPTAPAEPPPVVDLRVDVDAATDRVTLRHVGGDTLDVADLRLRIRVNGTRLARQPPVPFFAAHGFVSGPTGPFNHAGGTTWRAGQRASLRIASTNRPVPDRGDRVTVIVATERQTIAELTTTAT